MLSGNSTTTAAMEKQRWHCGKKQKGKMSNRPLNATDWNNKANLKLQLSNTNPYILVTLFIYSFVIFYELLTVQCTNPE